MTLMGFWRYFLQSALGLASLALSAACGVWAGLSAGALAGLGAGLGAFAALSALLLLSGLAQRSAARELERRDRGRNLEALAAAKAARERLASMRVPDPELAGTVQLCALRAASYIGACEASGTRDPRADQAIAECLELVDLYLKELDGSATERRFGLADADPFADARARVGASLLERARLIERAALDAGAGLLGSERMAIKEELQ